jgi:predicted ATPase
MLKQIEIFGFKSIRKMRLELKQLNVLIGANGAGKSNFIEIFRLLKSIKDNRLQFYIGKTGGANSLLHYGETNEIGTRLFFDSEKGSMGYGMQLTSTVGDTLIFADEFWSEQSPPIEHRLGAGHKETLLNTAQYQMMTRKLLDNIGSLQIFHFHDTSETARLRANCDIDNNYYLMSDGSNLAAILYKLHKIKRPYYDRIVKTIRLIAPFFDDFILRPEINPNYIQLRWRSRNSHYEFRAHQLSDGTLRAMALITMLLQPESDLPNLIVLDEPELGLHPYAITIITSLIQSVAMQKQVILATQSTTVLDHFDPIDVIIVEQQQGVSSFKRLNPEQLSEWLEEYTLSELWEKNVTGGNPSQ